MGLVVPDVIPVHTQLRVCTEGGTSSGYDDTASFDKSIYRLLSMQDDMKTIVLPTIQKNEWDLFLTQAHLKTAGLVYNTAFDSLNEYLGTIGVTNGIC